MRGSLCKRDNANIDDLFPGDTAIVCEQWSTFSTTVADGFAAG